MVRLIGFEDLVQIIEGLGRIKALFLQVILTHDQAAVIEGLVEQLRHKITLAVLQRQFLHIILQAQLFHHGVKVGRPFRIIADGDDGSVERQRRILALSILIKYHVGTILAGVQRQGDLGIVIRGRDSLHRQVHTRDFRSLLNRQPAVHIRQRGVICVIHRYFDGFVRNGRGAARSPRGRGRGCRAAAGS